jgi:hypothetical protein
MESNAEINNTIVHVDNLPEEDDKLKVQSLQDELLEIELFEILKSIDWQRFYNLCVNIGAELNERQWRFLKSIFLEIAISIYSNDVLTYVGESQEGCDFIIKKLNNLKIEMKFVAGCLFTPTNKTLKQKTSEVKLMNSNGTNTHTSLPESYADYLLIVDVNGAAVISKEKLQKYISIGGDGIKAKIPTNELHIISTPSNISLDFEKKDLNIKETIMEIVSKIIKSV